MAGLVGLDEENKNGPLLAQGGPLIGEESAGGETDVFDQRARGAPSSSEARMIEQQVMGSI
jgi:hypothetical protein